MAGQQKRDGHGAAKRTASKKPVAKKTATKKPLSGVRAQFASTCVMCERPIPVGAVIKSYGDVWVHKACWDATVARNRVLEGETFRSQAPPSFRRGNTPGASRKAN